ncbi:hypothetical protein LINPERHAP1_LOCUS34522 [Linum perenne]
MDSMEDYESIRKEFDDGPEIKSSSSSSPSSSSSSIQCLSPGSETENPTKTKSATTETRKPDQIRKEGLTICLLLLIWSDRLRQFYLCRSLGSYELDSEEDLSVQCHFRAIYAGFLGTLPVQYLGDRVDVVHFLQWIQVHNGVLQKVFMVKLSKKEMDVSYNLGQSMPG